MRELSKGEKLHFRKLAGIAYEHELGKELDKLHSKFTSWKKDEMNTFDLEQIIHEFHNGKARELYKFYSGSHLDLMVAKALHEGLLKEEEIDSRYRSILDFMDQLFNRKK